MRIGGEADRRARRQQNGFAQDSALEERVMSEPVSEAQIPC